MLLINIIVWGGVIIIAVSIGLIRVGIGLINAGYQLVTNHTKSVLSSIAIVFIIWFIIQFNMIVAIPIYIVFVIPIYIVFFLYLGLRFVATNIFVAMDEVFYLGFDMPIIMVWVFWGLAIGAAIQGYRELRSIYGRKWIGIMVLLTPMLLLTLVGVIKNVTGSSLSRITTPTVMEQNIIGQKRELIKSTKKLPTGMEYTRSTPTDLSSYTNMVLIPAGEFHRQSDGLARTFHGEIHVEAFFIDVYEVTNAQYKKFIDANPQWQKNQILDKYHDGSYLDYWDGNNYPIGKDDYPVTHVSWYAAMAYAQWADKRLPTETEWEKAARGGLVGMKYPWGTAIDASKANYDGNFDGPMPIGNYAANGYGLYDMSGNVSEWCLDANEYHVTSRGQIIPDVEPISVTETTYLVHNFAEVKDFPERAVRGGCWDSYAPDVRAGSRFALEPTIAYGKLGFRCVISVNP